MQTDVSTESLKTHFFVFHLYKMWKLMHEFPRTPGKSLKTILGLHSCLQKLKDKPSQHT